MIKQPGVILCDRPLQVNRTAHAAARHSKQPLSFPWEEGLKQWGSTATQVIINMSSISKHEPLTLPKKIYTYVPQ